MIWTAKYSQLVVRVFMILLSAYSAILLDKNSSSSIFVEWYEAQVIFSPIPSHKHSKFQTHSLHRIHRNSLILIGKPSDLAYSFLFLFSVPYWSIIPILFSHESLVFSQRINPYHHHQSTMHTHHWPSPSCELPTFMLSKVSLSLAVNCPSMWTQYAS